MREEEGRRSLVGKCEERLPHVKPGRDGRIISKCILKKYVVRMWARFMYVRT
jgi:actin-like ATPase involved in cell morphogenesis